MVFNPEKTFLQSSQLDICSSLDISLYSYGSIFLFDMEKGLLEGEEIRLLGLFYPAISKPPMVPFLLWFKESLSRSFRHSFASDFHFN
jgi:hypothetical protein